MTDELLAFGLSQMKKLHLIGGADATNQGIGVMTEARWKATRDMMVKTGLLNEKTEWQKAFNLNFNTQFIFCIKTTE